MEAQVPPDVSLAELDKTRLFHPYTALAEHQQTGPMVIASGEGARLRDLEGKEYIDGLAGLWCVNVGYGRREIADAVHEQLCQLSYYHSFASMGTETSIQLAERVVAMAPENMSKAFFGNSGSDANDTLVKLVWYYNNLLGQPKKKKIIARRRAYHGVTVAAGSLTGLPSVHQYFDLLIANILHVEPPYAFWYADGLDEDAYARKLAGDLDAFIQNEGPETIAAFFAEPIMGAGGVIVPPENYFRYVQEVLRKHDILMVADEVICGFGRLGRTFGSEVYGIQPDLMAVAKGITSGYQPLSGCLVSDAVWSVLAEEGRKVGPFAHGFTYTAHPVAAAAALANLNIIKREGLVENADKVGAYMLRRLKEVVAPHPLVGEVRGLGLIAGVELVAERDGPTAFDPAVGAAKRVYAHALREGLVSRALMNGDVLALSPPLTVDEADVDAMVDRMAAAIDATASELRKEGHWSAG